jgi:hypothetical protein
MSEFIFADGANKLSILLDMLHCLALALCVHLFYMAIKSELLVERLSALWADARLQNWRLSNYFANFKIVCLAFLISYNIWLIIFFLS